MRLAYYAGASTAAAAACLLKAFHQRPNFYSAAVYLSESNACLLILTNLLLMMSCTFIYSLQRALYGPLRPIEIEQLSEKAWYAVLDTLLAMPSFREDVGGWLLVMFVLLLAGKVWGWIAEGRVDILEQQPPSNPRLFHLRLATSLTISVLFDFYMLNYCVESVIANPRPGMMVIFTFEFAILSIFSMFTMSRYLLSLVEAMILKKQTQQAVEIRKAEIRAERAEARQREVEEGNLATTAPSDEEPIEVDEMEVDTPGWEDKRRYLFALEVFTDFLKLLIYVFFFSISITFNGLPMHIMRDVYMTFVSFSKRITDYVAYRKATSHMNARYSDATTEEIRGDACIVCREDMVAWNVSNDQAPPPPDGQRRPNVPTPNPRRDEGLRAKKLPCGHILHLRCLKAWLERQQVCPTCRRPVVPATVPGERNPGAVAGNAQAPGAQAQRPAGRQNPFRLFNLGPVRLGFLHLPDDHIENIVQHINQANANDANAAAPVADHGARRHDVNTTPETQGAVGQTQLAGASAPSTHSSGRQEPLHIQLLRLEQRILQEAHNLSIDQQQLATLRAMEGELARLRAQQIPTQPPVGITQFPRHFPNPTFQPPNQLQSGPSGLSLPTDTLHGQSAHQYPPGHPSLPSGLVLPEGWTLMPLHRAGGNPVNADTAIVPQNLQADQSSQQPENQEGVSVPHIDGSMPPSGDSVQESTQETGPTDDSGSPLFVAAQPPQTSQTNNLASRVPGHGSSASSNSKSDSWADSGWSFERPNDNNADTDAAQSEGAVNELPEKSAASRYSGKGKARAVEVEDAPEPDS